MDTGFCECNPTALGNHSPALTGIKWRRELVNDWLKNWMDSFNQADVARQEQIWQLCEVLGIIELEFDVECAVARIPEKPLGNELRQLAGEGCVYCLALTVDANLVQPEVKIAVVLRVGATIVGKAILEMLAVQDVGLIAIPHVEQIKRSVAAVGDKMAIGTQTLTDGRG